MTAATVEVAVYAAPADPGLEAEAGIVWELDLAGLDYVRETITDRPSPTRPISVGPGILRVGYTIAADPPNGPASSYWRRV